MSELRYSASGEMVLSVAADGTCWMQPDKVTKDQLFAALTCLAERFLRTPPQDEAEAQARAAFAADYRRAPEPS